MKRRVQREVMPTTSAIWRNASAMNANVSGARTLWHDGQMTNAVWPEPHRVFQHAWLKYSKPGVPAYFPKRRVAKEPQAAQASVLRTWISQASQVLKHPNIQSSFAVEVGGRGGSLQICFGCSQQELYCSERCFELSRQDSWLQQIFIVSSLQPVCL